MNRGKDAIKEGNFIEPDFSQTKVLISATHEKRNWFSATITPFNPHTDGNYAELSNKAKVMAFRALVKQSPGAIVDSASGKMTIDGLTFDKFVMTVVAKGKLVYTMGFVSRLHKGFDLAITFMYSKDEARDKIMAMLTESKFGKE